MTAVLIHYSASEGPVGLWREKSDGSFESYYRPDVDKQWQTRGTNIVGDRNPNSSAEEFFDRLCDHSAYADHFGMTDEESNVPLDSIMYRILRESVEE